ncbi:MAG: quinolinate synthase NadA [Lachnospiraceae bacterium]|nr:quinolinate synthase NadA [Lachnospiraceae bacterium]
MTKQEEIQKLKKETDAVILAHYYVRPEVQEIADCIGDSYFLSRKAVEMPNRTIVFCGVSFMGESAKLLNPDKTVLMPDAGADCPMAHMVMEETVKKARRQYADLAVVCYINSTAEIKSWSDVSVTSANAVRIVQNLPNKNILFIPDRNLAHFVAQKVPEKNFIYNEGYCPIHENMREDEIRELKEQHPEAKVLVHPECTGKILELADYVGSTSGIIRFAKDSADKEFIIGTESGVRYALEQEREDAAFYFPKTDPVCTDMKKITLDKIIDVLKNGSHEVKMNNGQADDAAKRTLTRMLELAQ